ncbi:hypothetical protein IWQ51_006268 [Labrenzia sp. EL_142]|nr:hypothetical protein [Labrenzia sp. EL_142]
MTDAKRLMLNFIPLLRESPFRIAPERAEELLVQMGGRAWVLEIMDGPANFEALPKIREIEGTYAALLSLWAVTASVVILGKLARTAEDLKLSQIVIKPGGPGSAVIELKNAAKALIRSEKYSWDSVPAVPNATAGSTSEDGQINNLFLAAASFVILHECGHLLKEHKKYTVLLHQQELEADSWAVSWVLKKVPNEHQREFRTLAVCIAFIWIGLIDEVRQATSTHPPAAQRFSDAFEIFGDVPTESVALEIGQYALKAFFNPTAECPQADCTKEGFISRLIEYLRRK